MPLPLSCTHPLQVIVSEWIVGEKLSESKPSDIKALAGVFLNCYLSQLMETGLLHADPHPGGHAMGVKGMWHSDPHTARGP